MGLVLIVVLLALAVGTVPTRYSRDRGYDPSSALTVALLIVLLLVPTGRR